MEDVRVAFPSSRALLSKGSGYSPDEVSKWLWDPADAQGLLRRDSLFSKDS